MKNFLSNVNLFSQTSKCRCSQHRFNQPIFMPPWLRLLLKKSFQQQHLWRLPPARLFPGWMLFLLPTSISANKAQKALSTTMSGSQKTKTKHLPIQWHHVNRTIDKNKKMQAAIVNITRTPLFQLQPNVLINYTAR